MPTDSLSPDPLAPTQSGPEPSAGLVAAEALLRRVGRWRWQAPILALVLVSLHQTLEHTLLLHLPRWHHFATQLLFYGLIGPLLAWWTLGFIQHRVQETLAAYRSLIRTGRALDRANRWLGILLAINRRLVQAEDEETLHRAIVELPQQVLPVVGVSLLPFDGQGRPMHVVSHGAVDQEWVESWTNRLVEAREAREHCLQCAHRRSGAPLEPCPLLARVEGRPGFQILCLALRRGGRDLGLLTLYLEPGTRVDPDVRMLLDTMADEMALALETQRLRTQEVRALQQVRLYRRQATLHTTLAALLHDTLDSLEAQGGCVFLDESPEREPTCCAQAGTPPEAAWPWLQGLVSSMRTAQDPLLLGDVVGGDGAGPLRALLLAPMRVEERYLGCLVWWSTRSQGFTRRHVRLATTIALQVGLLVENFRLSLRLEHQAALAERTRLAREIHDGLAQTLGYLKLRTGQIARWLQEEDLARARKGLEQVRELIAAAYVDAREAIDGLRLQPGQGAIEDWLAPLLDDFRTLSPVEIVAEPPPPVHLAPEIHVQLMRIVQEALGNVRKHSGADRVWIAWELAPPWLAVQIADNGVGFDPDDVPPLSRHGLRIMQERSELIGGELQILSQPGHGTQVVVRLPIHQGDPIHA